MFGIQAKIEDAARRAAFFTVGGILCAVGAGFLTAAAWFMLATSYDAQTAALVIGCVYFGFGLIMMGLGARKNQHKSQRHHASAKSHLPQEDLSPLQLIAVAFLQGFEQGSTSRKS